MELTQALLPLAGGALGGAALTAVAGFIGARIQRRAEHERWVRERRFEAYVRFLAASDRMSVGLRAGNRDVINDTVISLEAARSECAIVGPSGLYTVAKELSNLFADWSAEGGGHSGKWMPAVTSKRRELTRAARAELRFTD